MRSAVRLGVVSVAMLLAACGGSEEPGNAVLEHRRLDFSWGYNDAIKDYVVRDASAWETAWRENEPLVWPPDERPTIDFERDQVLGLARGVSGGCNGMGIELYDSSGTSLRGNQMAGNAGSGAPARTHCPGKACASAPA